MELKWIDKADSIGNSFGYATHQSNLRNAMIHAGVKITENADIALHIKPLMHYEKLPGKKNVVYTMWEYETLPPTWIEKLKDIDVLIVPCEHNKNMFEKYTDIPIYVCMEGVNTHQYRYIKREFPKDKPFRFYWFGVNNPRKGFVSVLTAWDKWTQIFPQWRDRTELYMKACNDKEEMIQYTENVYLDNRTLTNAELEKLDHDAHCYIFPTMGEGFGLTLAEAMSTGLPCLYTCYSAPDEYLNNDSGYPLGYQLTPIVTEERKNGKAVQFKTLAAYAQTADIVAQMAHVYLNYEKALFKGRLAAEKVRKDLTWEVSAQNLIDILSNI